MHDRRCGPYTSTDNEIGMGLQLPAFASGAVSAAMHTDVVLVVALVGSPVALQARASHLVIRTCLLRIAQQVMMRKRSRAVPALHALLLACEHVQFHWGGMLDARSGRRDDGTPPTPD